MTEDRLNHIERMFRHPPSAAALADLGLELVEALRHMRSPVMVVATHNLDSEPIMKVVDEQHFGGATPAVDKHAAPTPPIRETKRKAK